MEDFFQEDVKDHKCIISYLKYCECLSLPATDRIISGHLKQEMGTKVSYASCHLQHNDYPIFSSSDDFDHTEYVHSHG